MKYWAATLAGWLWLGMTVLPVFGATPKRVLIVHSFGLAAPPFTTHSTAFEAELTEQMGERVDLDEVSLDMARYADLDMQEALVEFLHKRQTKWQPDLVVPIGSPAGVFVAQFRDRLFPTTPILYAGMDQRRLPPGTLEKNAAFVGESFDLPGMVEDMLQVAPATTNIVVVIGASPLEHYWADAFRSEWAAFTNRVSFTWLSDLSFDQMLERVGHSPPRSFIFLILLMRDASGVTHNADEALKRIHAVANAPVNSIFQHQLGLGIVGGRLYQAELEGVESAHIAIQILHGEPATNFPPKIIGPLSPRYDWRELRRWQISEERLPVGSKVLFREPTTWERYRLRILGALSIIFAETGLIVLLIMNLLKRRRAEKLAQDNEERMNQAADSAEAGLWNMDLKSQQIWATNRARELFRFSRETELTLENLLKLVHPEDKEALRQAVLDAVKAGAGFIQEFRIVLADGDERWISARGRVEGGPAGKTKRLSGTLVDVTERRRAVDRLRLDAAVIENMTDGVVLVRNYDQVIVSTNPTFDRMFGYQPDELVGQHIDVINVGEGQHVQAITDGIVRSLRASGRWSGEILNRRKDGTTLWCYVSITTFRHPTHGDVGISIHTDVTAQHESEAEMHRLRLQAWHADRVARTGAITASLAHELNQPLAAILSNAQAALRFMATEKPDYGEIREILADIVHDDKRAGAVISGLRSMLRRQETRREPMPLGDAIQETLDLLRSELLGRQVEARLLRETDCTAFADKAQIQQVILNLVMNSLDAMRDQPGDRRRIEVAVARGEADQAMVSVRDTGPGISEEHTLKLFEAFWSSKPKGMGIGLPICRSIIESHGGRIWLANNKPGETTFRFTLPIVPTADSTQPPSRGVE